MKLLLVAASALLASACTYVKPEAGAADIALVNAVHVQNCVKLGEAKAQVKDAVIGIERSDKKVADELLTLARNEAYQLGGNTLLALGEPTDGQQRFAVYRC